MSGARPDTWMPLDIGRYLADTMHLNPAQHGVYLLLIMAYWRKGAPLPDDDCELCAIGRLSLKEWHKSFRIVMARFFKISDGVWWHKRIEIELAKAAKKMARASAGGNGKAAKQQTSTPQADDKQALSTCLEPAKSVLQLPSPSPSPKEGKEVLPPGVLESTQPPTSQLTAAYTFHGEVIRLKPDQHALWTKAYPALSLNAELAARDAWLANEAPEKARKSWFVSTSKYLANLNAVAVAKATAAREPRHDPDSLENWPSG